MKVAIIGAGLSGLACAYRLEQQNLEGSIDIFETKSDVGGANIFLEFVSELFHRPIGDLFSHLASEYKMYLLPQHTIYSSITNGPSKSYSYQGFLGHVVVRGNHENSLEKQLAKHISSNIYCNHTVHYHEIKDKYDKVILATGRLQDVPTELNVRIDRYVDIIHALISGQFNEKQTKMWFNDRFASKGYSFQLVLDESTSMISVATPDREFDIHAGWDAFVKDQFGTDVAFKQIHHVKNFAIGQPKMYSTDNLLLIGNAVGCATPSMGFGLHNALLTGIYAADSIVHNKDYHTLMKQHDKEYKWSLALRNALENMGNEQYDMLVEGLDSILGRVILTPGGFNINRLSGRLLSILTNEKKQSYQAISFKPFEDIELYNKNDN
ncbi:NAD(P)/FAD-dependent oxidoreductase [Bacillus alkalicellulosilyticus]|uniref:NAD(P)/FAD-dependent oxidoreductase n=1 Tax=Alkalihalobacterium alkalicellulosilyticum TaxID=1912214 RepID=UPI0009972A7D|nr:NAD(P)/FAD-dependent oxidoreductase [Bacillus alkalicellulosilyticus]